MLSLAEVKEAMQEKLSLSLIDEKASAKMKLKALTAEQVKHEGFTLACAGFLIPYFDVKGTPTGFKRLRYLEDTRRGFDKLTGRKAVRYTQLPGTSSEVYFPPFCNWSELVKNSVAPFVVTEGELKAACASMQGMPTLGLGGVWSFKSSKKGQALIDGLRQIEWAERSVIICYDSDAVANPAVMAAENALARELTALGAVVSIARLPQEGGAKVGLDDYLLTHEIDDLKALLLSASPFSLSEALHRMNETVVYIRDPGLIFDYAHNLRTSVDNFLRHTHANAWHEEMNGQGKLVKTQTATKWLRWECRSELASTTFDPGCPKIINGRLLNTWDGWAYEPVKGNVKPWGKLLDHIFDGADPDIRKWFEQWCAYPIQNPGKKLASGVLVWGSVQGSGKTLIGLTLMQLYGKYSAEIKDSDLEDGRFEWAENKQFILADDITSNDNRKLKRRLMTMITQKTVHMNPKFIPSYYVPDRINYYFTSNDPDAFYMDDEDRRFFIHEVSNTKLPVELRKEIVAWVNSEAGMQALMHYFLNLDLTGFDPDAEAHKTIAKNSMINLTKGDLALWCYELKEDPDSKLKAKGLEGDLFTAKELLAMYDPSGIGKVTVNGMARELARIGFKQVGKLAGSLETLYGPVRLYAIKNHLYWRKQIPKKVIEHYERHRIMIPVGMAQRIKYAGKTKAEKFK